MRRIDFNDDNNAQKSKSKAERDETIGNTDGAKYNEKTIDNGDGTSTIFGAGTISSMADFLNVLDNTRSTWYEVAFIIVSYRVWGALWQDPRFKTEMLPEDDGCYFGRVDGVVCGLRETKAKAKVMLDMMNNTLPNVSVAMFA